MRKQIPSDFLVHMASKFRMLSDPTRLSILRTLMDQGEQNVGQVVAATDGTQANVSKHLKQLAESGLVARRKAGLYVFYRLDDPVIEKICRLVCQTVLHDLQATVRRNRRMLKHRN